MHDGKWCQCLVMTYSTAISSDQEKGGIFVSEKTSWQI